MQYYSQSPIPGSNADAKAAEDSQYVNAGPPGERCDFTFVVDEQLNWVDAPGAVRVFSTRGKKCGLPKDPASAVGYCFWHNTDPDKFKTTDYRTAIEQLVERRAYLGGAFLSGEAYATPFPPVDLAGAKLQGAYLSGAYMEGTCLTGANLNSAHLQGAFLAFADLTTADLTRAHLSGTDFESAKLVDVELYEAEIDSGTRLDAVVWARDYKLANEKRGKFAAAEATYRSLKQHRQEKGDYHAAGEFYFREMECIRKQRSGLRRFLWTIFYKSSCGYGERPVWTFAWAFAVIVLWGLVVFPLVGIHNPDGSITRSSSPPAFHVFVDGLSLSLVTFATLGYGNRYPLGSAGELLAGCEALLGMLLSSIFVVSFAKKVIRG